jgi:aminoglycoside phosphotransferase (APT) family kinase protein
MVNVFATPTGQLGVIDWESATDAALPLGDFHYATVDATAAASRYRNRTEAFVASFGASIGEARRYEQQLVRSLGLSERQAELCYHACWLRHATEEPSRADSSFLEIARRIALAALRG